MTPGKGETAAACYQPVGLGLSRFHKCLKTLPFLNSGD